jgi:hypothetical protein
MNLRAIVIVATAVLPAVSRAQTAAEHIVLGDREHAAMNAAAALQHYQEAVAVDASNAEALWRASREAIDLGEFNDAARCRSDRAIASSTRVRFERKPWSRSRSIPPTPARCTSWRCGTRTSCD